MSTAREFARLLKSNVAASKRKPKKEIRIPVQKLREELHQIDGLRVRMPDLSRSRDAFHDITPLIPTKQTVKTKKFTERPKIQAELVNADLGMSNSVSLVIRLCCGVDKSPFGLRLRERFNLVELDIEQILLAPIEPNHDQVRFTKKECERYVEEADEISRRASRQWFVRRLYSLHRLMYDISSKHLAEHPSKLYCDALGEHLPVFILLPRSLDFIVKYPTLPLDILLTHRRAVISYL